MMRRSSGRCTGCCLCCPGRDVKYLAHAPALGRGPLSTRALTVWEQANGTCVHRPDAMGQGAALDEETQQREAVGWEYSWQASNLQTLSGTRS